MNTSYKKLNLSEMTKDATYKFFWCCIYKKLNLFSKTQP